MSLAARSVFALVVVCFLLSGAAGLIYQVVWSRYLALFLGSSSHAVVAALVCQALVMPFVCLGVAHGFGLSPELAVGLMLLSATPGGTVANPRGINLSRFVTITK